MIVLVCTGYQTWCDAETFSGRMIRRSGHSGHVLRAQCHGERSQDKERVRNIAFDCSEERLARRRLLFLHLYP